MQCAWHANLFSAEVESGVELKAPQPAFVRGGRGGCGRWRVDDSDADTVELTAVLTVDVPLEEAVNVEVPVCGALVEAAVPGGVDISVVADDVRVDDTDEDAVEAWVVLTDEDTVKDPVELPDCDTAVDDVLLAEGDPVTVADEVAVLVHDVVD